MFYIDGIDESIGLIDALNERIPFQLWEKLSSLLVDRYDTHSCRWFSEEHQPIKALRSLEELVEKMRENGSVKNELMRSGSKSAILLSFDQREKETKFYKPLVDPNDAFLPHDAIRKFSKDVQQLIKVCDEWQICYNGHPVVITF